MTALDLPGRATPDPDDGHVWRRDQDLEAAWYAGLILGLLALAAAVLVLPSLAGWLS